MKNNTAIFDATQKTITFQFKNEEFTIDLTEGDLEDSWNFIETKDGKGYDFNFHYEEEPCMALYEYEEGQQCLGASISFTIVNQIGTYKDYFGYEKGQFLDSYKVRFTGYIIVDEVASKQDAINKVKLMEVDFNDTNVEQIL